MATQNDNDVKDKENNIKNEKVQLDEVMKFLFSTSKDVLVKMLNGVFDEDFVPVEVDVTVSNNEFIMDTFETIRGDVFFDLKHENGKKASYHLEFQTKNDSTMIIRMFEYGFRKGREQSGNKNDFETLYFPKQKVIFIEKNKNIKDELVLNIIFPDGQKVIYRVPVIKYWEYTEDDIISKGMYPMLPLQLFNFRKELEHASRSKNINRINELSLEIRKVAEKIALESQKLFMENKILGDDFHKMLLAINNLIEYLNRNYLKHNKIEQEVIAMVKTLYDPEVERRGEIRGQKIGEKIGEDKRALKDAENLLRLGVSEDIISQATEIPLEKVREIRKKILN